MADEELDAETGIEAGAGDEEIIDPGSGEEGSEAQDDNQGSEASDEDRLAESLASELGWSPREKWRGSEEDWKPARDFLKTTVEVNKARGREIKSLHERVDRIARTSTAMAERAAAEARAEAEARFRQAVDEGDTQAAFKASQDLVQINSQQPAADTREPVVIDFMERNQHWLGVDPIATAMVEQIGEVCARQGKNAAQQVEEAEKIIRQRFPEYFEAERKPKAPHVETSGSRSAQPVRRGPKGYADLPAEAKRAALDFEKRRGTSREEYAKVYWQENA